MELYDALIHASGLAAEALVFILKSLTKMQDIGPVKEVNNICSSLDSSLPSVSINNWGII